MDTPPWAVRNTIIILVEAIYRIKSGYLLSIGRGNAFICRYRQIAMYLMHVTCGFPAVLVGEMFSRDRSTVSHASFIIENARDQEQFDFTLYLIEQSLFQLINSGEGGVS